MTRLRWLAGLLASGLAIVGLAACGGSSSSPLNTELSYLPSGSPLVLTLQTDPNSAAVKNTNAFLGRFPVVSLLESAVITRLKQSGVDYDADIKPLLGNPVALAITASTLSSTSGARHFVAVWVTKSAGDLQSLIKRTSSGLTKLGTRDGATLYGASGTTIAVDGATLILASTPQAVRTALDRHAHGGGITSQAYSRSTTGLPDDALIHVFGNVAQLLAANSSGRNASRVPWVAAIRGYGVAIAVDSAGVRVNYHVDTSRSSLSEAQLPIAPGASPPPLPSGFPIAVGLHDPRHAVAFIESVRQLTRTGSFPASQRRDARLRARTGVNFNDLVGQLTGDVVLGSDARTTLIRGDVTDSAATGRILARIAKDPGDAFAGSTVTRASEFYAFHKPDGSVTLVGVVSGKLLVGMKAAPASLRAFATAPTQPAAGAQGPFAFSVSLPQLIRLASRGASSRIPASVLKSLGNVTGWAANTVSGLNGTTSLAVR